MRYILGAIRSQAVDAGGVGVCAAVAWAFVALSASGCSLSGVGDASATAVGPGHATPRAAAASRVDDVGGGSATGPAIDDLKNLKYVLPDGREVPLAAGVFQERPAPDSATFVTNVHLLEDLVAEGDLDGNAVPDAAVVLVDAPGGSGSFVYLAAVVMGPDGPAVADTVLLGDRVQVDTLDIDASGIRLSTVSHGADDPMCCPSQRRVAVWSLTGGSLLKTADDPVE
ncbi:MAG: hypothetical protein ACE5EL_08620 [Anaerolineae bacterium]